MEQEEEDSESGSETNLYTDPQLHILLIYSPPIKHPEMVDDASASLLLTSDTWGKAVSDIY